MVATKVRVAVRVRPAAARESGSALAVSFPSERQIRLEGPQHPRRFTFDNAFAPHVNQCDVYINTAARLMQPLLDGFNVTILAYGQTGSGKSYSMGTTGKEGDGDGLVPRFLEDLFANLNAGDQRRLESKVTVSLLELYGENIRDLLATSGSSGGGFETSASGAPQVAEDKVLGVHVVGLSQLTVPDSKAALEVLRVGLKSRVTAETMMNESSSRSHAVFTVTLEQRLRLQEEGDGGNGDVDAQDADADENVQVVTSKLTFVDLAGSERLGRTLAEGQRMREGIQINQGLLALGAVINALCEQDERATRGGGSQRNHIPYRQSKLTRLLQDALGGNSQTLFLACVSPAADSYGETLSTLHYANRAKNIKNSPVKNASSDRVEARRLRVLAAALQTELVMERFAWGPKRWRQEQLLQAPRANVGEAPGGGGQDDDAPVADAAAKDALALDNDLAPEQLMQKDEVKAFLKELEERLSALSSTPSLKTAASMPTMLLIGESSAQQQPSNAASASRHGRHHRKTLSLRGEETGSEGCAGLPPPPPPALLAKLAERCDSGAEASGSGTEGGEGSDAPALEGDPEQELAILDRLIEWQRQSADYEVTAKEEQRKIDGVEAEIRETEGMLVSVRDTLQAYHAMRQRYEAVVAEATALRAEQERLRNALETGTAAAGTTSGASGKVDAGGRRAHHGGAKGASGASAERLAEVTAKLAKTENQLMKMGHAKETLEKERARATKLEVTLAELKRQKVAMQKRKGEEARLHRDFEQRKNREIQALRRSERKQQRNVGLLEVEVRRQRAAVERRNVEMSRMGDRLAQAQQHMLRLLALKNPRHSASRFSLRPGSSCRGNLNNATKKRKGSREGEGDAAPLEEDGAVGSGSGVERQEGAGSLTALSRSRVDAAMNLLGAAAQAMVDKANNQILLEKTTEEYRCETARQITNLELLRAAEDELRAAKLAGNRHAQQENADPNPAEAEAETHDLEGSSSAYDDARERQQVAQEAVRSAVAAVAVSQDQLEMLAGRLQDYESGLSCGGAGAFRDGASQKHKGSKSRGGKEGTAEQQHGRQRGAAAVEAFDGDVPDEASAAVANLEAEEARAVASQLWEFMAEAQVDTLLANEALKEKNAEILLLKEQLRAAEEQATSQAQGFKKRVSQLESENRRELVRLSMMDTALGGGAGSHSGSSGEHDGLESPDAMDRDILGVPLGASARSPLRASTRAADVSNSPIASSRRQSGGNGGAFGFGLPFAPRPLFSSDEAGPSGANNNNGSNNSASAVRRATWQPREQFRRVSGRQIDALVSRQRQIESDLGQAERAAKAAAAEARLHAAAAESERAKCAELRERLAVAREAAAAGASAGALRAIEQLQVLWSELGVPASRREETMTRVASAAAREAERQAEAAASEREEATKVLAALERELAALHEMLGTTSLQESGRSEDFDKGAATDAVSANTNVALLERMRVLSERTEQARCAVAVGVRARAELRHKALEFVRATTALLPAGGNGGENRVSSSSHCLTALLRERRFVCASALHILQGSCLSGGVDRPPLVKLVEEESVGGAAAEDGPYTYVLTEDGSDIFEVAAFGEVEAPGDGPGGASGGCPPFAAACFAVGDEALAGFRREVEGLAVLKAQALGECCKARQEAFDAKLKMDIGREEIVALSRAYAAATGAGEPALAPWPPGANKATKKTTVLDACVRLACDQDVPLTRIAPALTAQLKSCAAALTTAAEVRADVRAALLELTRAARIAFERAKAAHGDDLTLLAADAGPGSSSKGGEAFRRESGSGDSTGGGGGADTVQGNDEGLADGRGVRSLAAAMDPAALAGLELFGNFEEALKLRYCELSASALRACQEELEKIAEEVACVVKSEVAKVESVWAAGGAFESERRRFEAEQREPAPAAIAAAAPDDGAKGRLVDAAKRAWTAESWLNGVAAAATRAWQQVGENCARLAAAVRVERRLTRRAKRLAKAKKYDGEICELVEHARRHVAALDSSRLCNRRKPPHLLDEEKQRQAKQARFAMLRRKLLVEIGAWRAAGGVPTELAQVIVHRLSPPAREVYEAGVNGEKLFNLRIVQPRNSGGARLIGEGDAAGAGASASSGATAVAAAAAGPPSPSNRAAGRSGGGGAVNEEGALREERQAAETVFRIGLGSADREQSVSRVAGGRLAALMLHTTGVGQLVPGRLHSVGAASASAVSSASAAAAGQPGEITSPERGH